MIVTYHHIAENPEFVTVAACDLADHLVWLRDQGMAVDLDTYVTRMLAGEDSTTMMAVTFDDGYTSFSETALPLLERYDIPATLYVPIGHVGGVNVWDIPITGVTLSILGWEDLRELASHPLVTLGSHGMSHQPLTKLSRDAVTEEMTQSKALLEENLGIEIRHFSFPYGQKRDMPIDSRGMLIEAGYASACSNRYGRINTPDDQYMLRRIHINPEDTLSRFIAKCARRNRLKELKQVVRDIVRK